MTVEPVPASDSGTTLGALLADRGGLTPDARERLLMLEAGRHPTLDAVYGALGADIDLDTPIATARIALGGSAPDDAHLAAALDSAYRALASPRIVRATITADRLAGVRDDGAITTHEDDAVVLLVLADNRTDASVEFSAESHGEGFGGIVEARRTGSSLLDLGAMPVGKYLVPLLLVAGGKPTTVDLPIECSG